MDLKRYGREVEEELLDNILPFTSQVGIDRQAGGFYGHVGTDGTVDAAAPKGMMQHSRILWLYSRAYRLYQTPVYRETAAHAYDFIHNHFYDSRCGGYFWTVDVRGRPYQSQKEDPLTGLVGRGRRFLSRNLQTLLRLEQAPWHPFEDKKVIYGQAFAIFGLAEYYLATGEKQSLDAAVALYTLLQKQARDSEYGGYFDLFSRDWQLIQGDHQIEWVESPMIKSLSSQLHLLEAFNVLYRAWPDSGLRSSMLELIHLHQTQLMDEESGYLGEYFDARWQRVNKQLVYGHNLEAIWLLVEAAELLEDPALLKEVSAFALRLATLTLEEGVDRSGAVLNNREDNDYRIYWAQAEGMVSFLNAYQVSGDSRFLEASRRCWQFAKAHLIDRRGGGWHQYVTPDGRLLPGSKLGLWGGPYHQGRACMEVQRRIEGIIR